MPSSHEITQHLSEIAQTWMATAVLWHVVLALYLLAVVKQIWRPSSRTAALAASAPIASAAAFAWVAANPFNGVVLTTAALALGAFALRLPPAATPRLASFGARWTGAGLIVLAWVYPHFLGPRPLWVYIVASPIGLVPCPSLCVAIGLALYCDAFGSRAWGITAGLLGLFYGLFGVARLGVWIDLPLAAGAALLLLRSVRVRRPDELTDPHGLRPITPPGPR